MSEIRSIQKHIHMPYRKLQLVANMVRKMTPQQAMQTLKFTNKAAARPLLKSIQTAVANAKQFNIDPLALAFKHLEINQGLRMVRSHSGGKGRRRLYNKSTSHIKIVLTNGDKPTAAGMIKKSVAPVAKEKAEL